MGKKGRIIGAVAGVTAAAAATTAAVIVSKNPAMKKKIGDAAGRMVSSKTTIYHVKRSGDGWAVGIDGASRASSLHSTKREAVSAARSQASGRRPSQLVIYRADGTIQDSHSYDKEN